MNDDKRLAEAATRYFAQLAANEPVTPDQLFSEPALQAALRDLISTRLEFGQPSFTQPVSVAERAAAERVAARTQAKLQRRLSPPTITALRTAHKLSLAALARACNVPVHTLARLERGGIIAPTIPAWFVAQLCAALYSAEAEIRAALAAPPPAAALRLSARDGTRNHAEQPIAFDDAL